MRGGLNREEEGRVKKPGKKEDRDDAS